MEIEDIFSELEKELEKEEEEKKEETKKEVKKEEKKETKKEKDEGLEAEIESMLKEKPVQVEEKEEVRKEETSEIVTTKEKRAKLEFDFNETSPPAKSVWLIYGDKGVGKTTLAMSFPGEIACLSFDRKSMIVKLNRYNNDARIKVYDVIKYMDYTSPEKMLETSEKTFLYICALLKYIKENVKPDWIIIDGSEIFSQICEFTMRYRNKIGAFAGISNLNLWKERRIYIRQVHKLALDAAKKGLIYTTYSTKDEIVVQGELVTKKDVPKWIDVLIFETDYVLFVDIDPLERKFKLRVMTSKNDNLLPTGKEFEITDKGIMDIVGGELD